MIPTAERRATLEGNADGGASGHIGGESKRDFPLVFYLSNIRSFGLP